MPRFRLFTAVFAVFCVAATVAHAEGSRTETFATPIDALSVSFTSKNGRAEVSAEIGGKWTAWKTLAVEDEQDPTLTESNLIVFPWATTRVQVRGDTDVILHPIRISDAPVRYNVAATNDVGAPTILSRSEWGADESLGIRQPSSASSSAAAPEGGDDAAPLSAREKQCEEWQVNYPQEFRTPAAMTRDENGNLLRWPNRYSTEVKLLVVHHTAQELQKDTRSGVELMRALYTYHAKSRGWGDIGYHYVIDENGKIYEGKAGGDFVVGGHVYCNNVGTVGIALMGNFETSAPPQAQAKALQALLVTLGDRYKIDLSENTTYHGITRPPVVGHRDLLSTDCPGGILYAALDQVRLHAEKNTPNATVAFTGPQRSSASTSKKATASTLPTGFSAVGAVAIEGRPGGEVIIPVLFRAGKIYRKGVSVGNVKRSSPSLQLWQEKDGRYAPVRAALATPVALKANESVMLRVKVRLPPNKGDFSIKVGDVTYKIASQGKRLRTPQTVGSDTGLIPVASAAEPVSASSSSRRSASSSSRRTVAVSDSPLIRIRLSAPVSTTATIKLAGEQDVQLSVDGSNCSATQGSTTTSKSIQRFTPSSGVFTVSSWQKEFNRFRGTLECRIIDDTLTLINELPLEDYLLGLAEEPDSEPPEKQKAFAVAARTYALWYMNPSYRKFPGKPYDGSDSPAEFQAYAGAAYEDQNPFWLNAVRATAKQTLTYQGQLIKPPYFSASDGRTRTPVEAGWNNFPFADIYASKPDPWCEGMARRGHGVGMSGCGAEGQANEGKTYREILEYYYPGTALDQ